MAAPALTSAPLQRPRMLVVGTSFASVAAVPVMPANLSYMRK